MLLALEPSVGIALPAIDVSSGAAAVSLLLRLVIFDVRLVLKNIYLLLITNTSHVACQESEKLRICFSKIK